MHLNAVKNLKRTILLRRYAKERFEGVATIHLFEFTVSSYINIWILLRWQMLNVKNQWWYWVLRSQVLKKILSAPLHPRTLFYSPTQCHLFIITHGPLLCNGKNCLHWSLIMCVFLSFFVWEQVSRCLGCYSIYSNAIIQHNSWANGDQRSSTKKEKPV